MQGIYSLQDSALGAAAGYDHPRPGRASQSGWTPPGARNQQVGLSFGLPFAVILLYFSPERSK